MKIYLNIPIIFTKIIDDLIKLKSKKISEPKNNEFDNKIRSIMGKNFDLQEIGHK